MSPEEALSQQHKLEKKNLQATIQSLKKTATKGDKKKKKEVQDQIAKLESALSEKHAAELKTLKESVPEEPKVEELVEEVGGIEISDKGQKVSKAQKRRIKKDLVNKEREQRIAEQEVENEHGLRNLETIKIKQQLEKKGLMIFEIPSDGDCLYKALDHGLQKVALPLGVAALRNRISQYIRSHPNDYLPFLTEPKTGEPLNDEQFEEYCEKIANSKQWGGQVELDAASHVLEKALVVVQGEGPELVMGEEYGNQGKITLAYHRHMYRLGEHYNSVQNYQPEPDF